MMEGIWECHLGKKNLVIKIEKEKQRWTINHCDTHQEHILPSTCWRATTVKNQQCYTDFNVGIKNLGWRHCAEILPGGRFSIRENVVVITPTLCPGMIPELWMREKWPEVSLPTGTHSGGCHESCWQNQSKRKEHGLDFTSIKDGVNTVARQFQKTDKNISISQNDKMSISH